MKYFFKCIAVFRFFYCVAVSAYYFYTASCKRRRKIYCRLSAERCYNAYRFFQMYYIHYVLNAQRLKIKLIRRCIICRNGFGVVVYYYSLISCLLYCFYSVNGGIIKFHSLTYSYRSRAEHDHFLFIGNYRFVLVLIRRIEIWYIAFKFRSAGIYHLVHRENVVFYPYVVNIKLTAFPETRYIFIRKAHLFCFDKHLYVKIGLCNFAFHIYYVLYFFKEEHIYFCRIPYQAQIRTVPYKLGYRVNSVIRAVLDIFHELFVRIRIELLHIYMAHAYLK